MPRYDMSDFFVIDFICFLLKKKYDKENLVRKRLLKQKAFEYLEDGERERGKERGKVRGKKKERKGKR